ncbi:MAG TPA: ECF-type sigma factor, partial [Tepidisphaeraceae bacterium]
YTFSHPQTRFYNIASRLGARRHFSRNAVQVLDFFAGLVARRLEEGRRPLLIAKKAFLATCAEQVQRRLYEWGARDARVVTSDDLGAVDLNAAGVVPLINYGMIGTNLFESFDAAYCLTSYYVGEKELDQVLQDVTPSDLQIELKIRMDGRPLRRRVEVVDADDRFYDVAGLAPHALAELEMGVVLQAVGRVRPFTRPREVILFQANEPRVSYAAEFATLDQARRHFGIPTGRERDAARTAVQVALAQAEGLTQRETADRIGVSERTVQRYWSRRSTTRHEP